MANGSSTKRQIDASTPLTQRGESGAGQGGNITTKKYDTAESSNPVASGILRPKGDPSSSFLGNKPSGGRVAFGKLLHRGSSNVDPTDYGRSSRADLDSRFGSLGIPDVPKLGKPIRKDIAGGTRLGSMPAGGTRLGKPIRKDIINDTVLGSRTAGGRTVGGTTRSPEQSGSVLTINADGSRSRKPLVFDDAASNLKPGEGIRHKGGGTLTIGRQTAAQSNARELGHAPGFGIKKGKGSFNPVSRAMGLAEAFSNPNRLNRNARRIQAAAAGKINRAEIKSINDSLATNLDLLSKGGIFGEQRTAIENENKTLTQRRQRLISGPNKLDLTTSIGFAAAGKGLGLSNEEIKALSASRFPGEK